MRQALIINDTENWYHFGCTGTSIALKQEIAKQGFLIDSIAINSLPLFQAINNINDFDNEAIFKRFQKECHKIYEKILKSDVIVVNGEGTLHGINANIITIFYICYVAKIFLRKKVFIINHSAYPDHYNGIFNPTIFEIYRKIYNSLDFIGVRETKSYNLCQKYNIKSELVFDCLPLYILNNFNYLSPNFQNSFNNYYWKTNEKKFAVISGSVIFHPAHFNNEDKEKLLNLYQAIIQNLSQSNFDIVVLTGAKAYPGDCDENFVKVMKELNIKLKYVNAKNVDEWLTWITNAALLISGRFHHSIAAICLGTPFICFNSNTPKLDGVCEMYGLEAPINYNLDKNQLLELTMVRIEKALTKKTLDYTIDTFDLARKNFAELT